jgi:tRNA threonylcarbamoyladenosine biosynthesis protein TsaE
METLTRILQTTEEMRLEAIRCIEALRPDTASATIIAISGELGAGKTTFTQFIAQALGIEDIVQSPTFVIEKIYGIPEGQHFQRLIHIDAYRLTSASELAALGFGEVTSHPGNLIIIEWPENLTGISEQSAVRILLEVLPDGSRQITYA